MLGQSNKLQSDLGLIGKDSFLYSTNNDTTEKEDTHAIQSGPRSPSDFRAPVICAAGTREPFLCGVAVG
jgi:hypothetical protein